MLINCYGPRLHKGQQKIVDSVIKSNALFTTILAPRQFGKSFLIEQLMLYYTINNKNVISLFCAPSYHLVGKVFNEIIKALNKSEIIEHINRSTYEIHFINGSKMIFKSVSVPDNIVGLSIDYMFLDEASLYPDDTFNRILRPMLRVKGKKCFLVSTPRGKNYFYNMYKMSNVNERYESYKGSNEDNPYANIDEMNDAKLTLPENIFIQEYLAEFIEDSGAVFTNIRKNIIHNNTPSQTFYAGIDLGKQDDFTVMTILNDKNEIVEIYRKNHVEWNIMVNDIISLLKKYKPRSTMIEVNNIGDVVIELIKKQYSNIEAFTTSSSSKEQIIEHLILEFNNNTIKIKDNKDLIHELEIFTYEYNKKTRNVKYSAPQGFHDDCVISLAIANWARINGKRKGVYHIS